MSADALFSPCFGAVVDVRSAGVGPIDAVGVQIARGVLGVPNGAESAVGAAGVHCAGGAVHDGSSVGDGAVDGGSSVDGDGSSVGGVVDDDGVASADGAVDGSIGDLGVGGV